MTGRIALIALAALLSSPWATPAAAQSFPSRPIRIVVPFEAGGAMDIIIRVIGKQVSDTGAAQIVVENKTGAGGAIGVMAVKDAAPDGYTLAEVSSSTHVLNPHTTANIPYDPVKDFQPIAMLVKVPTLLAVPAGSPAQSLHELVALARQKPGGLNYGSAGIGSAPHITAALLEKSAKVPMTHVPYRGMAGAMTDLVGGRIDFVFSSIPSLGGFVADGKVRLLGVAGKSRIKDYPQLPSMAELGHPDVDVDLWFGLVAPLGTEPAVIRSLNEMFVKATNAPELADRFKQLGVEIATGTPAQFKQALESDNARLGPFVRELTARK
jgi:tripartite-type tricarboxylate transporter receptor subunit TctC